MLQQFGREATPAELAKEMDMPDDKIRKVMKIAKEPISMETPIGDDEDSHLGDFIEDTNVESPIDSTTNTNLMETVRDVLAGLTPRSEEHTSELQSLMRISYAVFCLKKKNNKKQETTLTNINAKTHNTHINTRHIHQHI